MSPVAFRSSTLIFAAQNFASDTHISFAKLRLILERVVRTYVVSITGQPVPEDVTLQMLLDDENVKASVPPGVLDAMHAVRIPANRAIHGEVLPSIEAARGIERILDILEWCATWWSPDAWREGASEQPESARSGLRSIPADERVSR